MLSVPPYARTVPETPAPGRVEEALGLVLAHAFPLDRRKQDAVRAYLLDAGPTPASAEVTAELFGMSTRWVRHLSYTAKTFARTVPPPATLLEAMRRIEHGGIRTGDEISASLFEGGLTLGHVPVRSLLRIGDLFGVVAGRSSRVVAAGPGPGPGPGPANRKQVGTVMVPDREELLLSSYLDQLHLLLRHQIAVPLPTTRGTTTPRSTRAAITALVDHDTRLTLHALSSEDSGVSRARRDWVWRAWDGRRQHHGVSIRLAQRLLAVRPRTAEQLYATLQGAVANLPPSQRYDARVPPPAVLGAWLGDVAQKDSSLTRGTSGWSWDMPMPQVDALLAAGCRDRNGPADSITLQNILVEHGYTSAASRALLSSSPVLRRVAPMKYDLR